MSTQDTKLILWVGEKHVGKTTAALKLAQRCRDAGFSIAGLLAPSVYQNGKLIGFDGIDLGDNSQTRLTVRSKRNSAASSFTLTSEGENLARQALSPPATKNADLVIVDEFGPWELAGRGFRGYIDELLAHRDSPLVLLVVRRELADKVRQLYANLPSRQLAALDPHSADEVISLLQREKPISQPPTNAPRNLSRLVIVSGSYPDIACGVSRHVEIIARLTAALGDYDVQVLTSDDPQVNPDLARGYLVHPVVQRWGAASAHNICRQILQLAPDIVHLQNLTVKYRSWRSLTISAVAALLKRWAPQLRLVLTQHDIALSSPILRRRYRGLFHSVDAVLVSNRRDYQAVLDQKIEPDKLYLAPVSSHINVLPRTPQNRAAARQALHIPPAALCIAYFGFIQPQRNILSLIRALDLLNRENYPVHAIFMGGSYPRDQRYFNKCRQLTHSLNLSDKTTWTGYADEDQIAHGLAAADIFVSLLQRGADLRNTSIITAMLAQLPVITTRNLHYYQDSDLEQLPCRFVSPDNPRDIALAIEDVGKNPPSADSLKQVKEYLDPQRIWQRHIATNLRAYHAQPPQLPLPLLST